MTTTFNDYLASELPAVLEAAGVRRCPWGHPMETDQRDVVRSAYCDHPDHPPVDYLVTEDHIMLMAYPSREGAHDSYYFLRNTDTGKWHLQHVLGDGDTLQREKDSMRWLAELNRL